MLKKWAAQTEAGCETLPLHGVCSRPHYPLRGTRKMGRATSPSPVPLSHEPWAMLPISRRCQSSLNQPAMRGEGATRSVIVGGLSSFTGSITIRRCLPSGFPSSFAGLSALDVLRASWSSRADAPVTLYGTNTASAIPTLCVCWTPPAPKAFSSRVAFRAKTRPISPKGGHGIGPSVALRSPPQEAAVPRGCPVMILRARPEKGASSYCVQTENRPSERRMCCITPLYTAVC